tara:strand:+ start:2211 stop:3299 length:1089 start_codon:yes stop_codon:yes gene_type:complete
MKKKPELSKQSPPNALQIELVEGCSLNCTFCGVQGIRETRGGYKYMTKKIMKRLCKRLSKSMKIHKWNPRVELAVHGEPTMHPDLVWMVEQLGSLSPRELILVTNGTGLAKNPNKSIDDLVEAGISSFCLDEYDGCDFAQKVREGYTGKTPIFEYSAKSPESFRGRNKKEAYIVIKEDVSHLTKAYDKLNTHCGGGGNPGETNPAIHKKCAKPFRELTIRWDGNVSLCCNDFRGIYKIGNISDYDTLDDLWNVEAFHAARQMLYHNSREFDPCRWCDALSTRVGLLPDKYGKKDIPEPDKRTARTISKAIRGQSYTLPVLRGWELSGGSCVGPGVDTADLATQSIDVKNPPSKAARGKKRKK